MEALWLGVRLLLLLAVANNAPIGIALLLARRGAWPLDFGLHFVDGRPLLGPSKTWRGVLAAIVLCALVAPLLGFAVQTGAWIGALSMLGDALASFAKRRLGIEPSGQAFGLDQVPEALLPLWLMAGALDLSPAVVVGVTVAFTLLETPAAWIGQKLGWRDRPY